MYRCIDLHPDDTQYHLFLWQDDANNGIKTFALQTVTFGIVCSPYLAIKTTNKLAELERHNYPLAYEAIKNEIYVDDVMSGGDTLAVTIELIDQLIQMLRGAGFNLRKWSSNSDEILEHIPSEYHENGTTCLLNAKESIKALGLGWSTIQDKFIFNINFSVNKNEITKRSALATTSRLFDPLGWLNGFITKTKLFMSKLWEAGLDWDDNLSSTLLSEWYEIADQISIINQVQIPRWYHTTANSVRNEIHIFCDSSQKAYASAVYLRTLNENDKIHVSLLMAKSKLSPLKRPLTIPRLELCGAVLATSLLKYIQSNLRINIAQTFMWTDSSIVLSWIRGDSNRWAMFVGNRINKILTTTKIEQWRHVISEENPADLNSRGVSVEFLRDSHLWWHGPVWLSKPQNEWPSSQFNPIDDEPSELRCKLKANCLMISNPVAIDTILQRFSNFNRFKRSIAYCFRFFNSMRNKCKPKSNDQRNTSNNLITQVPQLTVEEIRYAETAVIRWIQSSMFDNEIAALKGNRPLPNTSRLIQVNPFLDNDGILRVNGRLSNAFMPYNEKFPIILAPKHRFSELLIKHYHHLTLHGGPQITVCQLRQNYWILNARNTTRQIIRKCTVCFRNKPILLKQKMGALPAQRMNMYSSPFAATSIDFAGPFQLLVSKFGRGKSTYKGYVAVFTCMTTKAVHLEAVGDLTSKAFLNALDRFIARRNCVHDIYSDNGTNFVGACGETKQAQEEFNQAFQNNILPSLASKEIQWHFSPPSAPHFNGLVEAAVKSFKYHFKRIIGSTKLTFEEFSTVLARIESILNSRPISAISDNPNDFSALTPGHFLVGNSLRPRPACEENNPTKRFQFLETMVQHFWKRFKDETLSGMQVRKKWNRDEPNLKLNDLVIVKDDRFPLNEWPRGRVIELHPGTDGLVRVASVFMGKGTTLKRPIAKLCLLPCSVE